MEGVLGRDEKKVRVNPGIPKGVYCYDKNGICPHWSIDPSQPKQRNGYCSFLKRGDWEVTAPTTEDNAIFLGHLPDSTLSLLWDQCKECGIDMNLEEMFDEIQSQSKDS